MIRNDEDFRRIDILAAGDSVEARAAYLFEQLKSGEISISDLMGPLSGMPDLSANLSLPTGSVEYTNSAPPAEFLPKDFANTLLEHHVHPHDYINPRTDEEYDLVVIGAGVAGLLSVIVGSWLGKKCALIERHSMGGDCLNTGCVPSKALIACARAIHNAKNNMAQFGVKITPGDVTIDFPFVMQRMRDIRAKISHHDSVERYKREFCKDVYVGDAVFLGGNEIEVTGTAGDDKTKRVLKFKKAMIATGASPAVPDIPGLRSVPHLTNSNFFNLQTLPKSMVTIGCGPIGLELSQCMARFGSTVYCLDSVGRLLPKEDPDAVAILHKQLEKDGVKIHLNTKILNITRSTDRSTDLSTDRSLEGGSLYGANGEAFGVYTVTVEVDGEVMTIEAEALLNATGRVPNVFGLGLEKVGVSWDNRRGVYVNEHFQTGRPVVVVDANPNIYACGDCTSAYKFTHSADFQARMAVTNMFLGEGGKAADLLIPWCTYTDPEIAHVGKYETELTAEGVELETFTRQLADVDRCICDGVEDGFVKIITKAGTSQIIGATICGPNAGDMISEVTLAMQYGISVPELAGTIHPYPTTQESIRQACLGYNKYFKNPSAVPLATLRLVMAEKEKLDSCGDCTSAGVEGDK